MALAHLLAIVSLGVTVAGCKPESAAVVAGPIPQRGYLWQRDWAPPVEQAFLRAQDRFDRVILLGGEVVWEGDAARFVKSSIRWETAAQTGKPCGLALRIAPYRGAFASDDANARFLTATAKSLLAEAAQHGVTLAEFQLDFDCPQKKLGGYAQWLAALRSATRPVAFSITALPSWLDEPEFAKLIPFADNYVLEVHSVPARGANGRETLCDPRLAKAAAMKAARLGHRFSIALPTYRCLAGYDGNGKLLAVAMDSVQPNWPGGTRILEFASDAAQLAELIRDCNAARPALLDSIIWYRVPTDADMRNWRWPTLNAVAQGRAPAHELTIARDGENPIDLLLVNEGEAEEQFAEWSRSLGLRRISSQRTRSRIGPCTLTEDARSSLRSLARVYDCCPESGVAIGWLRHDRPTTPTLELVETPKTPR